MRSRMIFGYPFALANVAARGDRTGQRLDGGGLAVALATSEMIYEHQRPKIRQVYVCPLANSYAGRDAGFVAHECPAGGMRISAEGIVVEIVDAGGKPASRESAIRDAFRARLGAGVQVALEHVSVIEPEASGKHRYVISHVAS